MAASKDKFVKFTSELGNFLVAPSEWTAEDEGNTYSLTSPDDHCVIHVMTFTAEGSGSLHDFGELIAASILPKEASGWQPSDWTKLDLAIGKAAKRELIPIPEGSHQWRLYIVDGDRFYHAIVLNASTAAMDFNGEFYESIVQTFEGVRQ